MTCQCIPLLLQAADLSLEDTDDLLVGCHLLLAELHTKVAQCNNDMC